MNEPEDASCLNANVNGEEDEVGGSSAVNNSSPRPLVTKRGTKRRNKNTLLENMQAQVEQDNRWYEAESQERRDKMEQDRFMFEEQRKERREMWELEMK